MVEIDLKKAYIAPQAKGAELGVMSVFCGSQDTLDIPDYVGGAYTEGLEEQDLSESIW